MTRNNDYIIHAQQLTLMFPKTAMSRVNALIDKSPNMKPIENVRTEGGLIRIVNAETYYRNLKLYLTIKN